eukprot:2853178-Rhodomonas_salina.1
MRGEQEPSSPPRFLAPSTLPARSPANVRTLNPSFSGHSKSGIGIRDLACARIQCNISRKGRLVSFENRQAGIERRSVTVGQARGSLAGPSRVGMGILVLALQGLVPSIRNNVFIASSMLYHDKQTVYKTS